MCPINNYENNLNTAESNKYIGINTPTLKSSNEYIGINTPTMDYGYYQLYGGYIDKCPKCGYCKHCGRSNKDEVAPQVTYNSEK